MNLTERLFADKLGVKPVLFRPPYSIDQEPDTADQVGPLELMANPQHEGGEAYFVDSKKPFASISKEIASELRSFYRVSYTPSNVNDTTYRKLTVQVRGMRHVAIHARDGYSTAALR